jgi:hypothetical protein
MEANRRPACQESKENEENPRAGGRKIQDPLLAKNVAISIT